MKDYERGVRCGRSGGMLSCLQQVYSESGVAGLFNGLNAKLLQTVPAHSRPSVGPVRE